MCALFRQILADKEAAAVSDADHEELDWWFDVEEGFQEQHLSEKAWSAFAAQVNKARAKLGELAGKQC